MSAKGYSAKKPKMVNGEPVVPFRRRRHKSNELAVGELYGKPAFYAYEIEQDFPEPLKILNSAGAWWMNKYKVEKLLDAFRMDCSKKEACHFAGISVSQLQYFIDKHPHVKDVINHCKEELGVYARQNVARDIKIRRSSLRSAEYLDQKARRGKEGGPGLGSGNTLIQNNGVIFMDFSDPNQKEPVVIDPETIHEAEVIEKDDAES